MGKKPDSGRVERCHDVMTVSKLHIYPLEFPSYKISVFECMNMGKEAQNSLVERM